MNIQVTIQLGADETLSRPVKAAPKAVLKAFGGDPAVDSCTISVNQTASVFNPPPPPAITTTPAGGDE